MEMIRVTKPQGRLLVLDPLGPESDSKIGSTIRLKGSATLPTPLLFA